MEINLHLRENLRDKDIGEKVLLDTLEVIDKNEKKLLCLDSSGELDYYDFNGNCLSEDHKPNISTYEFKYVLCNDFSLSDPLILQLEADLNSLCHNKIRKLMIYHDSIKPRLRLPECISRGFKFSIIKDRYLGRWRYVLEVTVPNSKGSCLMDGHWTEDLSLPVHPGDPSRLILYREGLFISRGSFDIYIEDPRAWDWKSYNGRQF